MDYSVHVRKTQIRKSPSFLSPVLAELSYGDQVAVLGTDSGWSGVQAGSIRGFVHESALTSKKVILNPDKSDVSKTASSQEYALAGKGFNQQVEGKFRTQNPGLNFAAIDRMENYGVAPGQIRSFMLQGRVFPKGGQG